jgi:ABC-2 type transport system ATP-binding protein
VRLNLQVEEMPADLPLPAGVELIERTAGSLTLRLPRLEAAALVAQLLQTLPVADLTVEDPPIETVIDQIYSGGEL